MTRDLGEADRQRLVGHLVERQRQAEEQFAIGLGRRIDRHPERFARRQFGAGIGQRHAPALDHLERAGLVACRPETVRECQAEAIGATAGTRQRQFGERQRFGRSFQAQQDQRAMFVTLPRKGAVVDHGGEHVERARIAFGGACPSFDEWRDEAGIDHSALGAQQGDGAFFFPFAQCLGDLEQAQVEPGLLRRHPTGELERKVHVAGFDRMANGAAAKLVFGRHGANQGGQQSRGGGRIARGVGGARVYIGAEGIAGHRGNRRCRKRRPKQKDQRPTYWGNWGLHRLRARPS